MLTEQTDLTMKFTILDFPLKSYQHKHKDISHLKDYLPEEQKNPWEEKGILQTATEIGQKNKSQVTSMLQQNFLSKLLLVTFEKQVT